MRIKFNPEISSMFLATAFYLAYVMQPPKYLVKKKSYHLVVGIHKQV